MIREGEEVYVLGGSGPELLRATLEELHLPKHRISCAVATLSEALAAQGLARAVVMAPWPGERVALSRLCHASDLRERSCVQTIRAGMRPLPAPREALGSSGMVIPASAAWAQGPFRRAASRSAILAPGGGMILSAEAFEILLDAGWFDGEEMSVSDIDALIGGVRVLPREKLIASTSRPRRSSAPTEHRLSVTIVIPAHNEEASIGATVSSVVAQTRPADRVLVIDDGSTDRTGEVAAHYGADVLRGEPKGSKGAAINGALPEIDTDVMVVVDADTLLERDALAHLMRSVESGMDATHGAVLPSTSSGIWAKARTIEYSTAIRLAKPLQRYLGRIMVLSGCVLAIRTDALREAGGFQERTMVEDLDLTWTLHTSGYRVGYAPRALAYPLEPANWKQYRQQLVRWSHGFFQSVSVHARSVRKAGALLFLIVCAIVDILLSPLALAAAATAAVALGTVQALLLVAGWQLMWVFLCVSFGVSVVGLSRSLRAAPSFLLVNIMAPYFYVEAMISEWVLKRRLQVWHKGH